MLKKIAVAMAVGGLMAATVPAHAAGHFSLSLGLPLPPLPGVYVAPAPAYYGPPAVYEAPAPVVYEAPRPYPYYYGGTRFYGPRVVYREGPYYRGGYRGEYHGYYGHGGWHR